jgi:uncharacterized protein YecE (DUF72 family)
MIIGTAGWSIPKQEADKFGDGASALARYATRFCGVEINTTFYRSHRPDTYRRWASAVPANFRFSLKAPRAITHEMGLVGAEDTFLGFVDEVSCLESKAGPILLQLPPKLEFIASVAERFLGAARAGWAGGLLIEPRHISWFSPIVDQLLARTGVSRVGADPARAPDGHQPGGERSICYLRLHGSPKVYFSSYGESQLADFAQVLIGSGSLTKWCVFDNTASGAATGDALRMMSALAPTRKGTPRD